jgi:hypothetical protein
MSIVCADAADSFPGRSYFNHPDEDRGAAFWFSDSGITLPRSTVRRAGCRRQRAYRAADTIDAAARPLQRDLPEIVENRYEACSVIIASSSLTAVAAAILDRLAHALTA